MRSKPMTEAEHKELSEYIRKRKAAHLVSEKRRANRKAAKPASVSASSHISEN